MQQSFMENVSVRIRKNSVVFLAVAGVLVSIVGLRGGAVTGWFGHGVMRLVQRESASLVGKSLSDEFFVSSGTDPNPVSLRSLVVDHPYLLTYHPQCSSCQVAVNLYLDMARDEPVQGRPALLVLADSPDTSPPSGLPMELFLRPVTDELDPLLQGLVQVYPIVWRFDIEGRYLDRLTAFDPVSFKEFLSGGQGDSALQ